MPARKRRHFFPVDQSMIDFLTTPTRTLPPGRYTYDNLLTGDGKETQLLSNLDAYAREFWRHP